MLSASNTVITHDKIIEVMAKFGYEQVKDGVCNGLAQMWAQAIFCGETEVFITRLYFICEEPNLIKMINLAKAKKGLHLTDEDQLCIDVLAFFDGVQLYQNFVLYTHLFNDRPHHLDAAAIAELTLPIKLKKRSIIEIYSENRLFNHFSLQRHLNLLAEELSLYYKSKVFLEDKDQRIPELVISLHSCTHKIVLRYIGKTTSWELADANQYTPYHLPAHAAASVILLSLTEGLVAPVNISVFTLNNNKLMHIIQNSLKQLKSDKEVSKITARLLTPKKTGLLTLTAMRGDKENFINTAYKIPNHELWDYMVPAIDTALYHGQTEIIDSVMHQFPDCLLVSPNKQQLLFTAIITRQLSLIETLISFGVDIDAKNAKGQPALHIAIEFDNLEAVEKLVKLGADINLSNHQSETPIVFAIKAHRIAIINFLASLDNINFEILDAAGDTALITATKNQSTAACEVLLRHKANPNGRNEKGESPLHIACELGNFDYMKILIGFGADQTCLDIFNRSPIFIAVLKQNWEMAGYLLLNLTILEVFNPFSYQLTIGYLKFIIQSAADMFTAMRDNEKQRAWSDIKHHRNALGMMLMKKPSNDFCAFFKPKEKQRQAYLKQLRSAAKPDTKLEIKTSSSFARL